MKYLRRIAGLLIIIAVLSFGWYEHILRFFTWLVMLNYTPSSISLAGDIFVRLATFGISFAAVGAVFSGLGWFDRGTMKAAYFILSTLISFGLSWIVMVFETHIRTILIILGILLLAMCFYWGLRWYNDRRLAKQT